MPILWVKTVTAERVGDRAVRVQCDKCGCEYFYVLTRIAAGSASTPYGIRAASAAQTAEQNSQQNLDRQLAHEAELVPCPQCNWINDDLVAGFRRTRYKRLGTVAMAIGFLGSVASLLVAYCVAIGPPQDRPALPYFLYGGPSLFLSTTAMTLLLRAWLRSRIRPNRTYPAMPMLPAGTPPALLRDAATSELKLARPREEQNTTTADGIEFRLGHDKLPLQCCGCLQSVSSGSTFQVQISSTFAVAMPRCEACARIESKRFSRVLWITSAVVGVALFAIGFVLKIDPIWSLAGVVVAIAVAAYIAGVGTAPVKIARRDMARGVVTLRFRNREYERHVAKSLFKRPEEEVRELTR